ncbi:hypothetical protein [Flectobacillus longus]|uniref:hypothetical protein n=1 Tax=Flectobacillus longus TaxID=2984207 RepID=UPI0024B76AA3|nr:hypothetical protein [Flectobacillus longus]MDI9880741.1 hypothetical protein [Flectobacillus longus]
MIDRIALSMARIKSGIQQPERDLDVNISTLFSNTLPLITIREILQKLEDVTSSISTIASDNLQYNFIQGVQNKLTTYETISITYWSGDLLYLNGQPLINFLNYLTEIENKILKIQISNLFSLRDVARLREDFEHFNKIYEEVQLKSDFIEQSHKTVFAFEAFRGELDRKSEKLSVDLLEVQKDTDMVLGLKNNAIANISVMTKLENQAKQIVDDCKAAFSASTTVGLAKSFSSKAIQLQVIMAFWVIVLFLTLMFGIKFGTSRLDTLLSEVEVVTKVTTSKDTITINWSVVLIKLILVIISFGGTIWAAWLATKQIGMYFRLSEDYGYKSALAKAYSGYKFEAERIDKSFYNKLFNIALERLDESPVRLVDDKDSKNTPIQEFLESKMFSKIVEVAPQLKDDLIELIKSYGKKDLEKKEEKKE